MTCPLDTVLSVVMITGSRKQHKPEDFYQKGSQLVYFCNKVGFQSFFHQLQGPLPPESLRFLVQTKVVIQETCIKCLHGIGHKISIQVGCMNEVKVKEIQEKVKSIKIVLSGNTGRIFPTAKMLRLFHLNPIIFSFFFFFLIEAAYWIPKHSISSNFEEATMSPSRTIPHQHRFYG